ncbi:hypothetical protein [Pseudoxanthomonas sp. JBR18]|uniref:hypothetical protein n=1 Tax=Pseudoxanthomonas sp. JBR18 TaxID=2969308 RepID=UPI0023069A3E|nr:hypothetical protein [Pseudoxanthomonas sp. JBR18]WCE05807.1 hypothetical protein PJ250_07630 [Pseudoxanthomonas sp. JBR18]
MTRWIVFALWLLAGTAAATSIVRIPIDAVLAKADHVLVATIVEVDMVDQHGRQVTDRDAVTGPGSTNAIRYKLHVEDVLKTNATHVPAVLVVNEWGGWHKKLGQEIRLKLGSRSVYFLSGPDFHPADVAQFRYRLDSPEWKQLGLGD